jgi:type 1 glutamine amidotransferase
VEGQLEKHPVAWVNTSQNRRVFYTSLGSPEDFANPAFRRLFLNGILWTLDQPIPPAEMQLRARDVSGDAIGRTAADRQNP